MIVLDLKEQSTYQPLTTLWVRLPYSDGSSDGSNDELSGRFGVWLLIWAVLRSILTSILLMLRRAEGTRDLYVSLIHGNLLSFKVWFLIQHPAGDSRVGDKAYVSRMTSAAFPLAYLLSAVNSVC